MRTFKTKRDFEWNRSYSAIPGSIHIPAGTSVNRTSDGRYFISSNFFLPDKILQHDATYYGCHVDKDNVEEIM